MDGSEQDFLRKLRATFRVEADEHLHALAAALLGLEKGPAPEAQRQMIDRAFRAAHSLKGAARAVDYTDVESACEQLEDTFSSWKRQKDAPSAAGIDALHRTIDLIRAALAAPGRSAGRAADDDRLAASRHAAPEETPRRLIDMPPATDQTVRIPVATLDARLIEAEEMLAAKLAAGQHAVDLEELRTRFDTWKREYRTIEPDAARVRTAVALPSEPLAVSWQQAFTRVLDFLDWNQEYWAATEDRVKLLHATAARDRETIGRHVDDLLESSKRLLLLPFGTVAMALPKLVRDLARDLGKEVDLNIVGEEIQVDKRVLEEIRDPLIHLLRNALDHGIETPLERRQAGKPPRATITVSAARTDGRSVLITVSDDGGGIDPEGVRASAVERGLISADEARQLADADAPRLIFAPDVSTSAHVTRVSGRGLGLAIVREKVDRIGGSVSVESVRGERTRFTLVLPSTLATFRGVLVAAGGQQFVVPTNLVDRVVRIRPEEIRRIENRETLPVGGRSLVLVGLAAALDLPLRADGSGRAPFALVAGSGGQRVAFAVDAILDEQEVLVKPLRPPLSRVRNVAGVTVLASGRVVPILNVADLLKSARRTGAAPLAVQSAPTATPAKSVLVAEDSITSRMLIKGILEAAGYRVRTAADGIDALSLLRTEPFDLLVTDVEMPRLNGFDLASRVRADARLAEMPIVLVTARDTPEDRARGVDVAADAYIVKGTFDQRQLLEAVRRLL